MAVPPTTVSPGSAKTYRHDGISFHFLLKVGVAKLEEALQGGDGRMLHVRAAVQTDHLADRNDRRRRKWEERRDHGNLGESDRGLPFFISELE